MLTSIFLLLTACYSQENPNFVILSIDDLGWNDVSWRLSTNVHTPNLESLRLESLEFTSMYTYPLCTPSRASFFTGREAQNIGTQNGIGLSSFLSCSLYPFTDPVTNKIGNVYFTEKLRQCGAYKNYYIGKWHTGFYRWMDTPIYRGGLDYYLGYLTNSIDYDTYMSITSFAYDMREGVYPTGTDNISPPDGYTTYKFGNKAIDIIKDHKQHNPLIPFTLQVAFNAVHSPVHDNFDFEPFLDLSIHSNSERIKYNSMLAAVDNEIGRIIQTLKDESLWDNTYIIWYSDNGGNDEGGAGSNYPLRGAKSTNFEGGIKIPMLVSGGPIFEVAGQTHNGLAHMVDIYATTMDIVNLDTSDQLLDGISFKPALITPNIQTRTSIIIGANNYQCNGMANGITLCGGIIKNYGSDGIFKLIVGDNIEGGNGGLTDWGELQEIRNQLLPSSKEILCDPQSLGLQKPTDLSRNCANIQRLIATRTKAKLYRNACLYRLDQDPCEYNDIASDTNYAVILRDLIGDLREAYDSQVTAFIADTECKKVTKDQVLGTYTNGINPWGEILIDPVFARENAVPYEYTGNCMNKTLTSPICLGFRELCDVNADNCCSSLSCQSAPKRPNKFKCLAESVSSISIFDNAYDYKIDFNGNVAISISTQTMHRVIIIIHVLLVACLAACYAAQRCNTNKQQAQFDTNDL